MICGVLCSSNAFGHFCSKFHSHFPTQYIQIHSAHNSSLFDVMEKAQHQSESEGDRSVPNSIPDKKACEKKRKLCESYLFYAQSLALLLLQRRDGAVCCCHWYRCQPPPKQIHSALQNKWVCVCVAISIGRRTRYGTTAVPYVRKYVCISLSPWRISVRACVTGKAFCVMLHATHATYPNEQCWTLGIFTRDQQSTNEQIFHVCQVS